MHPQFINYHKAMLMPSSKISRQLWVGLGSTLLVAIALTLMPKRDDRVAQQLPPVGLTELVSTPIDPAILEERWIVSPVEAIALLERGATLLDVRATNAQNQGMLQGSIAVTWQQFSQPDRPNQGKLLENERLLTQALQAVGISHNRPVVVVADPANGWGEDGRIVWMLRTLGHSQAVLVDGGYDALVQQGVVVNQAMATTTTILGDFTIQRTEQWEITQAQLLDSLDNPNVVIVDVREPREYEGRTPYGEIRGGHIPGAIHLYYRDLLDEAGNLRSRQEILALLKQQGVRNDREIQVISYCTGGIRSGWFTTVLTGLGFDARNYAGSMWEWSAAAADVYPLVNSVNIDE